MGVNNTCSVLLLVVLCIWMRELNCQIRDHETFENIEVEWCNESSIYSSRIFCEKTKISHSNSLAANVPTDRKDWKYANINGQNIPTLYENSLANLDLDTLIIGHCGIKDIEIGAFTNTTLNYLSINYNSDMKTLKKGIFKDAKIAIDLYLMGNGLTHIDDGVFEGMTINSIQLTSNDLEEISPGVFGNVSVQFISLKENRLTSINKDLFSAVMDLQLVDLSENMIKTVEVGSFENMVSPAFVYLQNNLLEIVPEGIFSSKLFVELLLDGNNINKFAPGAFSETGVGYLNVTGNKMDVMRSYMFNESIEIEYLLMSQNGVSNIEPGAFDRVTRAIDLSFNDIKVIKKDTFTIARTVVLLRNKKLKKIEEGAFCVDCYLPPYVKNEPWTLYLEKDNLLDRASKDYLQSLISSGKLIWREMLDGGLF